MSGTDDATLRRLRMRSIRRGIKEMDLILSAYADRRLDALSADDLALYEALLFENDQDLYRWVSGQEAAPPRFSKIVLDIAETAEKAAREARFRAS
ncbi:succinate dehydrogenase assembly factor 2 [Palleronia rufa]|uniref:succinate dehydrogenase assembly factor 2 n=1 Tax=Palleronia rufa TaxID=1530186 RepID=UPI00055F7D16|nr:succinate dehydrogenase assembly factor 2 [Palleronia rufa]